MPAYTGSILPAHKEKQRVRYLSNQDNYSQVTCGTNDIKKGSLPKLKILPDISPLKHSVISSAAHNQIRYTNSYTDETVSRLINVTVETNKLREDLLDLKRHH